MLFEQILRVSLVVSLRVSFQPTWTHLSLTFVFMCKASFIRKSSASHPYIWAMQAGVLTQRCFLTTFSAVKRTSPCLPNLNPLLLFYSQLCVCDFCAGLFFAFEGHGTSFQWEKLKQWFISGFSLLRELNRVGELFLVL